ncbi:diacylglycerol kinase family lipid kinase [Pedobacter sp. LMG 31464]|uniref:Diacylglycerol kinase family lipid kinase n=1 Tax=Pedobacter planticolens TaxID=2679964 RepID=A0A923IX91_9SPHI|nr:diacylglycerol kinase family protein [Pedobacter planticolens]MBB2146067.1 diacylglycerol kinase family lipid kinase [Pedobacter planticolens]
MKSKIQKLLFIVNPGSGNHTIDFKKEIKSFFKAKEETFEIYELPKDFAIVDLKETIKQSKADRVIAVGGDGTLKLVAECLLETGTPIGIIPAGSANGMAKELRIPLEIQESLTLTISGKPKQIHAILINGELCIHLADIGFNAYLVKKFDELQERGMWTYAKATWHAFWYHRKMDVEFKIGKKLIKQKAAMVAIANATQYGSGLQINPDGKLDDALFEIILVKEYAVMEILKIWISKLPWNPKKIESFQVSSLKIITKHKVHFQVDGEYIGKVNEIEAKLISKAIYIIAGPSV